MSESRTTRRGVVASGLALLGGLGLLTVAFPLFAVDHLGVERSAAGYMWAAFAVGSTLGALSLVRIQRRFPPERIVLTGYAVFGLLMLSWPLAGSLPVFLALVSLAALVDGPALAAQFATRQRYVPPSLYGQVFTRRLLTMEHTRDRPMSPKSPWKRIF